MPITSQLYADLHTHTIASDHAYSTILENAQFAASHGIGCIAMTDHAPLVGDAPHIWNFINIHTVPEYLHGVRILKGAEVNLLPDGKLDLEDSILKKLDWVLVSIHKPAFGAPRGEKEHTNAYMTAIENPYVDALGHSGLADYAYDIDAVVKRLGELHRLIEINEHTYDVRVASVANCEKIALACKKHGVGIVIGSDAHFAYSIGENKRAVEMLNRIEFPEQLVVNRSEQALNEYLKSRKQRIESYK